MTSGDRILLGRPKPRYHLVRILLPCESAPRRMPVAQNSNHPLGDPNL